MSKLQRTILSLAGKNDGTVLARDVLIAHYSFQPIRVPSHAKLGGNVFDRSEIGARRYNAASVAVCKAFNRLVDRGMAKRIYSGVRVVPDRLNSING